MTFAEILLMTSLHRHPCTDMLWLLIGRDDYGKYGDHKNYGDYGRWERQWQRLRHLLPSRASDSEPASAVLKAQLPSSSEVFGCRPQCFRRSYVGGVQMRVLRGTAAF